MTTGNPFWPTQAMELRDFLPATTPEPTTGGARVGYPSVWKGGVVSQCRAAGSASRTSRGPRRSSGASSRPVTGGRCSGIAAVGMMTSLLLRPRLFLMTVPYVVTAFLFYSCWSRPDRRYIVGIYTMIPFLVTEGIFGIVDVVRAVARRRGDGAARPVAVGVAIAALLVAFAPIPLPQATPDQAFLSKDVLSVFARLLPLAIAAGAGAAAVWPRERVTRYLAPALALVLVGFAVQRADATRALRAPFPGPQARAARENFRALVEPRSS